jgi:hypothetical protein
MPVVDLQLEPTTDTAEQNTAQAMRRCHAQWVFAPRRGSVDKGYTARTSSDVCVSTGFVFTSPESAASAPPVGTACAGGTGVIA